MRSIVVAYDQERGIGKDNDLPWGRDLPADLKHFKDLTFGGSVIMGRNTYDSIGQALVGRENIVVTSRPISAVDIVAVNSLSSAFARANGNQFVIGGQRIFASSLPEVDVIYATEVQHVFPGVSVYFPELSDNWREKYRESHKADAKNKYDYDFVTYVRN